MQGLRQCFHRFYPSLSLAPIITPYINKAPSSYTKLSSHTKRLSSRAQRRIRGVAPKWAHSTDAKMLLRILRCALDDNSMVWVENLEKAASSNPPKKRSRLRHHLVTQPTLQDFIGNTTDAKVLLRILPCALDDNRLVWE